MRRLFLSYKRPELFVSRINDNAIHSLEGFTLVEVIVSLAIVGLSLVMVMQLFSAGLKSAKSSGEYTVAIIHAKDIMEELSDVPDSASGEFEDGFRWEAFVQDHEVLEESEYNIKQINVKVMWPSGRESDKFVELVSLKTVAEQ